MINTLYPLKAHWLSRTGTRRYILQHANTNALCDSYVDTFIVLYNKHYHTLPKCRFLCDVDYESMPSFSIFSCSLYLVILHSFDSCYVSCPGIY